MADVDAPFVQQVFDLAQRQREPDVEQHRRPDNGWRAVEITERIARAASLPRPHQICSDNASRDIQHPSQQGEIRGKRSPGALCTSFCPILQQAVPDMSHNAVFRPAFLDRRPGTAPPCPTIVPVRCEPVPVYPRVIPLPSHFRAIPSRFRRVPSRIPKCLGVCSIMPGGCPLRCAASVVPMQGAPGPGLPSAQLQGPWKPVLLRARRAWRCPRQWPEAPLEPRTDACSLGVRSSSQRGSLQANPDSLLADSSTLFRRLNSLLLVTGNSGGKRQEFRGLRQPEPLLYGQK